MIIRADVKCYYCGFVSGQLEGDSRDPLHIRAFRPAPTYGGPLPRPGDRVRCGRCGGPVFLDEIEVVRERRRAAQEGSVDEQVPALAAH